MESLAVPPTAEPRGSSIAGDEFVFLKLFLRYTMDSSSRVRAAPIEPELFGVETRVKRLGFYSGPHVSQVLQSQGRLKDRRALCVHAKLEW
ncbi:hypothetical protein E6H34_04895 [Candidatus Bathyarchaeota archaeon]|nr:MAG: hypothetical protein E6H34_04895 [Candidatus Bathyarchaeota archaeon]